MMKNFNTIGVHLKLQIPPRPLVHEQKFFLGGGGGGGAQVNRLKRGASWIVCRFKRELGKNRKKEGVMFLR